VFLLAACSGPIDGTTDSSPDATVEPGEDDTLDGAEDDPGTPYGPENDWDGATTAEVPDDLGAEGTGFNVGDVIPNATLVDQHGNEVELYQFYGKVVLLDVMTMWCGPCQDHAPSGEDMWQELQDEDFVLVALMQENRSSDSPTAEDGADWAEAYDLTHPILADDRKRYDTFADIGGGYPTYPVIGPDMRVVHSDLWLEGVNADALRRVLEAEGIW
jgi:peroxiredoxin